MAIANSHPNSPYIHYSVTVKSTTEHLLDVNMTACIAPQSSIVVSLPAWIPGSYMIRDFARNLHYLNSQNDNLEITRLDKQSWQLSHKDKTDIIEFNLQYQIYAFDLSVRSAFIDDQYAFFNGTSVFLSIKGLENIPHSLEIDAGAYGDSKLKDGKQSLLASSLLQCMNTNSLSDNTVFSCNDYYELIDHPVLLGQFNHHSFTVNDYTFHLVFSGQHAIDFARLEQDLTPIIQHHLTLFGELPCAEYWFITLVCEQGFGGLEHIASTVLQYSRFDLPLIKTGISNSYTPQSPAKLKIDKNYQQFLSLCSHELFHTWHVKQIKPHVMHQPDLSQEVYTEQMWIYEGFTSLYDDLSLARTKLISPQDYIQVLNENITRLLRTPGRQKQSVAESSFEAWSKFYKQDAGSVNHIVSYYNKGAIVALCLDITLRQQSSNAVSLDHIMQKLWSDFGKPQIGTSNDVITQLCQQYYKINIESFVKMATQTTSDLPLQDLLKEIGLQLNLRPSQSMQDKGGPIDEKVKEAIDTDAMPPAITCDVGANFSNHEQFLKVNTVQTERAASLAGLQVNDIIVAVDGWQCNEKRFYTLLQQHNLGDNLPLHILRDGRLICLTFTLIPAINDTCDITIIDESRFYEWLGITSH